MADGQNLLRPLRSDSLKPRPSTQAVWNPGSQSAPPQPRVWNAPEAEKPAPQPPAQPAVRPPEPEIIPPAAPETPVESMIPPAAPETPVESIIPPQEEPVQEPAAEEPLPGPQTFLFETFAPEVVSEPVYEPVPEEQAAWEDPLPAAEPAPGEEEPFDLDAVIASILAEDDEDEDGEEEAPSVQDALPSDQMPAPAFVPLYETEAPKRRKKGWLWLVLVVLIAAGAVAAWHCGWLDGILP